MKIAKVCTRIGGIFGLLAFSLAYGQESTKEPVAAVPFELEVRDGRLTASLEDVPLDQVLNALNRQQQLTETIVGYLIVDPDYPLITGTVENLPIHRGIQRLLKPHNFIFTLKAGEPGSQGQIRIGAVDQSPLAPTTLPPVFDGTDEPKDRIIVMQDLFDMDDMDQFQAALPLLITDPDKEVRAHTLGLLALLGDEAPAKLLTTTALHEPDSELRLVALMMLAHAHQNVAKPVLQRALTDPDPTIAGQAVALLDMLKL